MSTVEDMLVICQGDDGYTLFVLDINGDSPNVFVDKRPTLRVKSVKSMCFCLLDSCVYMFHEPEIESGFEMFKFDLGRDIWDREVIFEPGKQEEEKVDKMKSYKELPDSIKTPDGRIMVFSRYIRYYRFEHDEDKNFDFEIFDPKSGLWTQLIIAAPPFTDFFSVRDSSGEWIKYFDDHFFLDKEKCNRYWLTLGGGFFINNTNTFVIRPSFGGMFSLNLDALEEGWKQYEEKIRPSCGDFLLFEGLTLTPYVVEREAIHHSFETYRHHNNISRRDHIISILNYIPTAKKCKACIVGTSIDGDTQHAYIICDLFNIDLSLETAPANVASFKYSLKEKSDYFCIAKVLPIMATELLEKGQGQRAESPEKGQVKRAKTTGS